MSSPSKRRHLENCQAVDHISSLPDTVICHILSFMSTKSAVKTSILAKRWKHIWRKVPVLDFSEMPHLEPKETLTWQQKIYFRSFVDRVLLHNHVSCIQRLNFYLIEEDDDFYINSWLGAIMRREIREIKICIPSRIRLPQPVPQPKSIFSCERLVVLKLDGNFAIDIPNLLHLPNLEIIDLTLIHFPSDEFMKSLTLGCPVLKELVIVYYFGISSMMYIESLTLKKLEIEDPLGSEVPLACVVIKAPNLTYLHLNGALSHYDISDLSSLVEANLDMYNLDNDKHAFEILSKVSGVYTLQMGLGTEYLFFGRVIKPPIFWNLNRLRLNEVDERALQILEFAPRLKFLILQRVYRWNYSSESKSEQEHLARLENVEYVSFGGKKVEMRFVAYILKAASVLKELRITLDRMNRRKERASVQRLLKLPRSSVACRVELDFDVFW